MIHFTFDHNEEHELCEIENMGDCSRFDSIRKGEIDPNTGYHHGVSGLAQKYLTSLFAPKQVIFYYPSKTNPPSNDRNACYVIKNGRVIFMGITTTEVLRHLEIGLFDPVVLNGTYFAKWGENPVFYDESIHDEFKFPSFMTISKRIPLKTDMNFPLNHISHADFFVFKEGDACIINSTNL